MALALTEMENGKILEIKATERLTSEDYRRFRPEVDKLIQRHGRIRVLFDMHDFHGWNAGALWQDIKFDWRHSAHIERLALVGEKLWQKWMAGFCRPFTKAEIRYFDHAATAEAHQWLATN